MATGTAAAYRKLPDKSQNEIKEVAKEPSKWGESIEKAWDTSKIGAEHFKQTSATLSSILVGRRDVPPLRVFMIPGSQVLLGIMARVTPWRLVPDDWVPISALKKVREEESTSLDEESSLVRRLLRR